MKRALIMLAAFTALALVGTFIGQLSLQRMIEQRLEADDLSWSASKIGVGTMQWSEVKNEAVEIDTLSVELGWPITVSISGARVDIREVSQWRESTRESGQEWRPRWQASTEDLTLNWGEDTLVSSLRGRLHPNISLVNGDTAIEAARTPRRGVVLAGRISGQLPHPNVRGSGELEFQLGQTITFRMAADAVQLEHPFIAEVPLPPARLSAAGVWDEGTGGLSLKGAYGDVNWTVDGYATADQVALNIAVPLTPLASVVDLFGDGVPEARRARISGEVSLGGQITGPNWAWTIEPGAKDLSVSDATPGTFGQPIVRWKTVDRSECTQDAACTPKEVHHITGPRTAGWVSLAEAGWMPEAVIAAEDIRFRSHPGFDLIAIQEALANAASDERLRGGSTITQQLAKNLFLDGRRTLRRKLRELLLALSMEERMTKDAILTLYLNVVEFGPGIWGIQDAADAWFLKQPDQLSVREAAFLASILPAPRMWHQRITESGRAPRARVNGVLDRMRRRGSLSHADHALASAETLRVVPPEPGR